MTEQEKAAEVQRIVDRIFGGSMTPNRAEEIEIEACRIQKENQNNA